MRYTTPQRRRVLSVASLAAGLLVAGQVSAAPPAGELAPPARYAQPPASAVPLGDGTVYPQAELQAVPAAAAGAAATAQMRVNAEEELDGWVRQQYADFEQSREYTALVRAQDAAYAEFQRVRTLVIAGLKGDADYAALSRQLKTVEGQVAGERGVGSGASNLAALSEYRMRVATEVSRREAAAINADTEVAHARDKMLETATAVREARQAFQRQLRSDDSFRVAVKSVRQARVEEVAARAYYRRSLDVAGAALDFAYAAQAYTPYRSRQESYYPVTGYYGGYSVGAGYTGAVYVRQ